MNEAIKVSSFGSKNKFLVINEEFIRFNNQTIVRKDIVGIKQYARTLQFYRFRVGEQYYLGFQTPNAQIDILLTCYFNINEEYFDDLEDRIIEEIWEQTTDQIWHASKNVLVNGGTITVGTCQISKKGLLLTRHNALVPKPQQITWPELHYQVLHDRVVINNQNDYSVYTNLYFKDTWNMDVFIALLDWITQENGLGVLPDQKYFGNG